MNFLKKSLELRLDILKAITNAKKGHIGGAFSVLDILVSLYYGGILKYNSKKPNWDKRDKCFLSKGHAGIAQYCILADLGFFPKKELEFFNNQKLLGEHPDKNIPGIEAISGSLGHGLSIGIGVALGDILNENRSNKTYVILGDGDCYEGSTWEAANFASNHSIDNLTAVIDRNYLITHGSTERFNKLEPLKDKWEAFGWEVSNIDGHDFKSLTKELKVGSLNKKPKVIIANTLKGKEFHLWKIYLRGIMAL